MGARSGGRSPRERERGQMVETTIAARGVRDQRVLEALRRVPRERFVAGHQERSAYEDHPLPIECGQTISQPYVVALMAEAAGVGPEDHVLEVGTGSGYGAAVLAQLAGHVTSLERHGKLAGSARKALGAAGIGNVEVVHCDGWLGHPRGAPYSAIVVTAAAPEVPGALLEQLADGGRLVMPLGHEGRTQRLVVVTRTADEFVETDLGGVSFVPLVEGLPDT